MIMMRGMFCVLFFEQVVAEVYVVLWVFSGFRYVYVM